VTHSQVPPGAPISARLASRIGPEVFASILAVAVLVAAILVFQLARGSGPPSAAVVPPGPTTPAASASAVPTPAAPTPTPLTTATPDSATARAVLQLVDELLVNRSDLAAATTARRPSAQDIADRLRAVNATLVNLAQPLADLQRDPVAADIARRSLAISDATREAVTETQRASITNVAAYKAGGEKVVTIMAQLVDIRAELVAIAGSPPPG